MTTVANKGGLVKTLSITRNSDNTSGTMLKTPFLKKSENYSVQVASFCTNRTPIIHRDTGPVLRIRSYQGANNLLPDFYSTSDWEFHPKQCYSISEFVLQMQDFLHRFGYTFFWLGIENEIGKTQEEEKEELAKEDRNNAFYFTAKDYRIVGGAVENVGYERWRNHSRIVTCKVTGDGLLQFELTPLFSANFYIEVGEAFQRQVGLAPHLFLIQQGDGSRVKQNLDTTAAIVGTRVVPTSSQRFTSRFGVENLDERLSLDLQVTFPNSNKILVVDGVEKHEYILARFPYNNLKRFTTKLVETQSGVQDIVILDEHFGAGLVDLTRGNANYESNFLLNGDIQQISVSLFTRYYEHGVIETIPTEMSDGLWYMRLIFAKKL